VSCGCSAWLLGSSWLEDLTLKLTGRCTAAAGLVAAPSCSLEVVCMWQCYTFNELHWRDTHSSGTPYLSVQALHLSLWQDGDTISRKLNIQTIAKQECHAWGMLLSLVSPIAQCATGGGTGNLCGRTSQTAIRQCGNHQEPFNCACAGQISCGAGVVWSSALLACAIGCIYSSAFPVLLVELWQSLPARRSWVG
jgi:hypothetical protein